MKLTRKYLFESPKISARGKTKEGTQQQRRMTIAQRLKGEWSKRWGDEEDCGCSSSGGWPLIWLMSGRLTSKAKMKLRRTLPLPRSIHKVDLRVLYNFTRAAASRSHKAVIISRCVLLGEEHYTSYYTTITWNPRVECKAYKV